MLKILLALDDYQEQVYLHRLLTKMGFNIEVTQTDQAIGGLIMGFQPQVVFVAEKGRKINAIKLIKDIKAKKSTTQFILLKALSSDSNSDIDKLVQNTITSPVHPEELFTAISEVSHLKKTELLSKYEKLSGSLKSVKQKMEDSQYIQGHSKAESQPITKPSSSVSEDQRSKNYQNFLKMASPIDKDQTTFERKKIKEFNKELRSQSEFHESPELKIDKFKYTKNLLKKKN